jgi:hypothetical protein
MDPDIAFLQEAMAPPPDLVDPARLVGLSQDWKWASLLYCPRLELREGKLLWGLREHGRVVFAEATAGDRDLCLVSLHAWTTPAVVPHLNAIFDQLEELIKERSFVIAGDFNSCRFADRVWPGYGHLKFFERIEANGMVNCHWRRNGREDRTFFFLLVRYHGWYSAQLRATSA